MGYDLAIEKNEIVESKEQNKLNRNKLTDNREQTDGCQVGGGLGNWMKKVKG